LAGPTGDEALAWGDLVPQYFVLLPLAPLTRKEDAHSLLVEWLLRQANKNDDVSYLTQWCKEVELRTSLSCARCPAVSFVRLAVSFDTLRPFLEYQDLDANQDVMAV
jgi:hypothetical protein